MHHEAARAAQQSHRLCEKCEKGLDMTMTVDEALSYGASGGTKDVVHSYDPERSLARRERNDVECMMLLAAEVERLQKVVADQALTIGCLKDDGARLVQRITDMGKEADARNQKLKWFEDREAVARRVVDYAKSDWDTDSNVLEYWKARRSLLEWEREHPKPHDPDELDKHLASQTFRYNDLSAFKPSPEFDAAIKKAMDQFHAWRCPKCGATGRMVFRGPEYDSGFFLENANTLPVGSIVCSKGCANE